MLQTREVFARLQPAFQNLMELNRASISQAEFRMLTELFEEYETRGSAQLRRTLRPIKQQLQDPGQRKSLGIKLEPAFQLD